MAAGSEGVQPVRDRMFPRWGAALFALLPISEILYTPVTGQTVYAAALASLICALACAGAARIAPHWQGYRVLQWLLALLAIWPLCRSLARMGIFLQQTVFGKRPLWSLLLLLAVCTLLAASTGLNRCAMWALPVAWLAGAVIVLSGVLTVSQLQPMHWSMPDATLPRETGRILLRLLPASLILSLSLPEPLSSAAARGLSAGLRRGGREGEDKVCAQLQKAGHLARRGGRCLRGYTRRLLPHQPG